MGTLDDPVVGNVDVMVGGVVSADTELGNARPLNNKKVTAKTVTALKTFLKTKTNCEMDIQVFSPEQRAMSRKLIHRDEPSNAFIFARVRTPIYPVPLWNPRGVRISAAYFSWNRMTA